MSGSRVIGYRLGDTSEYLATYLLSRIGHVVAIPRQEDFGFDFYGITHSTDFPGVYTFNSPYLLSLKSNDDEISFGNIADNGGKWKIYQVDWLKRLFLPLIFGTLNRDEGYLDLYCGDFLRHHLSTLSNPSQIVCRFKQGPVEVETINDWGNSAADGKRHIINLGCPLLRVEMKQNQADLKKIILELNNYLNFELLSLSTRKIDLNFSHYYEWDEQCEKKIKVYIDTSIKQDKTIKDLLESIRQNDKGRIR